MLLLLLLLLLLLVLLVLLLVLVLLLPYKNQRRPAMLRSVLASPSRSPHRIPFLPKKTKETKETKEEHLHTKRVTGR